MDVVFGANAARAQHPGGASKIDLTFFRRDPPHDADARRALHARQPKWDLADAIVDDVCFVRPERRRYEIATRDGTRAALAETSLRKECGVPAIQVGVRMENHFPTKV